MMTSCPGLLIHGRRQPRFAASRQQIEKPQHLVEVPPGGHRVGQQGRAAGFARYDVPAAKLERLEVLLARAALPDEDVAFFADLMSFVRK
jgi:hypothetical protein